MFKWLGLCLLFACSVGSGFAASFNCEKASSVSEKLICASPELSNMDERYAKLYNEVKVQGSDVARIKKEAVLAWKKREADCADAVCLSIWYRARIATLNSELLKPAACINAQNHTQLGINKCAAEQVRVAETVMNQYYQKVMEFSSDSPETLNLIKNSKAAWISYSEDHCSAYQALWSAGGSIGPFMYQRCRLELINKHTHSLWQSLLVEPGSGESALIEPYPLFSVQ